MPQFDIVHIKEILKYNAKRKYMADFAPAALSDACAWLKRSQEWEQPMQYAPVAVGKIDGDVICNALWREMSCNPVRFGTVSPFMFDGKNDIVKFCKSYDGNNSALRELRKILSGFIKLNRNIQKDNITTAGGKVFIHIEQNGHMNREYQMLSKLRKCIKLIADQNVADLMSGGEYQAAIIAALEQKKYIPVDNFTHSQQVGYQMTIFDGIEMNDLETQIAELKEEYMKYSESIESANRWVSVNRECESPAEIHETEQEVEIMEQKRDAVVKQINDAQHKLENFSKYKLMHLHVK